MKFPFSALAALTLCLGLGACATPSADSLAQNDPWETTNRHVFAFDMWVERNFARPVAQGYRDVVPDPAREGLHNVVTNLHAPVVLANDVLQGDTDRAAATLGRILINSTIGLGGLIDVASKIGIPRHHNDFGITMGKAGVHEGSYIVLPLLGPKPPRDIVGSVVDGAFDPMTYARFEGRGTLLTARSGVNILVTEERNMDQIQTIERSSLDFYATTRNLYRQSRGALIEGRDAEGYPSNLPDL